MTCAWCGHGEDPTDEDTLCKNFDDTKQPVCGYCANHYRAECDARVDMEDYPL